MFLRTIARPLLAAWFIYGGVESIIDPEHRAERSAKLIDPALKEVGLEEVPTSVLVQAHGVATVAAATALAFSKTPKTSATALGLLAAITAVAGRPFWLEEPGHAREAGREAFIKNISLLGGVMIAATAGNSRKRRKATKRK